MVTLNFEVLKKKFLYVMFSASTTSLKYVNQINSFVFENPRTGLSAHEACVREVTMLHGQVLSSVA